MSDTTASGGERSPGDGAAGPAEQPEASGTAPGAGDAPLRGVRVLAADEFSVADAIGGVRGLVESVLPGLVFVVVYVATRELTPALVSSIAVALAAVVVRLAQRTPVTQAFSGLLGIGIGVFWAWRTGDAEDYFAWGLWVNVAWSLGALVSILVRWPAVGVVASLVRGQDMSWRTAPDAAHLRSRYVWATWLWVAVFGGRLAVQVPLYLQGDAAVAWLGTAKLVMGVPLFALGLWITWLLVAAPGARAERRDRRPTPPR
ncbi:DUF3159 domain-containing protein [Actinotalea subterranea]|uniref:DUF3159 domain-containing protein n=1 Tax=Actinotalea subterranea TaxID=2607497 RepID=UPI001FE82EF8|nr:DUF3159 domain-containing protein [Actinotalea subterranea]